MADLIRDAAFGQIVRLITKNRVFQYPEEKDPSIWKKYVNEEKSGYAAHHGTTEPHGEDSDTEDAQSPSGVRTRNAGNRSPDSDGSERTAVPEDGAKYNEVSGVKIDPEKGRDLTLIDWEPNDPQVCGLSLFDAAGLTWG